MIDEEATFGKYGYYSTDWAQKSNKKIVAICDDCGAVRYPKKCDYRDLCVRCVKKTDSFVEKQRADKLGKPLPEAQRQKIRDNAPRGKDHANWKGGKTILICIQCGQPYPHRVDNMDKSSFCSMKCKADWQSENMSGENAYAWQGGKVVGVCMECGEEFFSYPYEKQLFCSIECSNIGRTGEKSTNWRGGASYEPYCEKFSRKFKENVRDEFDRKCFLCGKDEERNGQKMGIHHVSYLKDCLCGDVVCDFVPLCKVCHGMTGANRQFWECLFTYALQYHDNYYNIDIPKPLLRLNI